MALAQATATVTIKSGYGWTALPSGVGTVISATVQFTADLSKLSAGPSASANVGPVQRLSATPLPVMSGVSTTASAFAPQGVIAFGPGTDGPAPDGTYNIIIWSA